MNQKPSYCPIEDKKDVEEVRKRAMERLGDRMTKIENEGNVSFETPLVLSISHELPFDYV